MKKKIKVCFISDTHLQTKNLKIPACDILIHCGDLTFRGDMPTIKQSLNWLANRPNVTHKVFIAGNHDWLFEKHPTLALEIVKEYESQGLIYLQDQQIELEGLKIYGTPWQPFFCNWAFNVRDVGEREKIYSRIPEDLDILITHCPPLGILDRLEDGTNVGCPALLDAVLIKKPKIHAFGHIHPSYGGNLAHGISFFNAAVCDDDYVCRHDPILIEVEVGAV